MYVCTSCGELWGAPLLRCHRGKCVGQLRPVDERDASHPVVARFPMRALVGRTAARPVDPAAVVAISSAGSTIVTDSGPAPAPPGAGRGRPRRPTGGPR